jgi:hypothetical protein
MVRLLRLGVEKLPCSDVETVSEELAPGLTKSDGGRVDDDDGESGSVSSTTKEHYSVQNLDFPRVTYGPPLCDLQIQ